jgi:hypothetical protein
MRYTEDIGMMITSPGPGSRGWLGIFRLICLLSILLVTAAEALADESLVYVGTYTGK